MQVMVQPVRLLENGGIGKCSSPLQEYFQFKSFQHITDLKYVHQSIAIEWQIAQIYSSRMSHPDEQTVLGNMVCNQIEAAIYSRIQMNSSLFVDYNTISSSDG